MGVYKIVLTGGPCAGKSTVFDNVKEQLEKEGYYVICVPETAREYMKNGVNPDSSRLHTLLFQDIMFKGQVTKEENSERYAEFISHNKDIIILYDRAIMDNRAYLNKEDYGNLLSKYDYNELDIIDKYDMVIDLVSTATLKPESYITDKQRHETKEEAAANDICITNAWLLHRNFKLVKPTETLEEKSEIVLQLIHSLLNKSWTRDFNYYQISKQDSDFSIYNDENSRRMTIANLRLNTQNIKEHTILSKRNYNGATSYVLEKRSPYYENLVFNESKLLSYNDYLESLIKGGIYDGIEASILAFAHKGDYYRIIDDNNDIYLETSASVESVPENITVSKVLTKSFAKQKSVIL